MTSSCPGFAQYQALTNHQVEVNGIISVSTQQEALLEAWGRYGGAIDKAARRHGVPAPWLVGIMMAESRGDSQACSPCSVCSPKFCHTALGRSCCAWGLMQFIKPTAERYGVTVEQLVQNPSLAIDVAAQLVRDLSENDSVGHDIVRIAAAYNGGFNRCGKEGTTFGWHTNNDYPMTVVKFVNLAVELDLAPPRASAGMILALSGVAVAVAIYAGRTKWMI